VEKFCTAGQATDDNVAHVRCMLGDYGYKHNSIYVILIAFPLQHWLQEHTSILCRMYIACLVEAVLRFGQEGTQINPPPVCLAATSLLHAFHHSHHLPFSFSVSSFVTDVDGEEGIP
jgi:hypothetical protein